MSSEFIQTASERILMWMSELGAGSWRGFKEACEWAFRDRPADRRPSPSVIASHLSERGYVEFDWAARRWAVAPTVITTVPGLPSAGIVVGGRTRSTLDHWESLDAPDVYLDVQHEPRGPSHSQRGSLAPQDGVRTVFVIADDAEALEQAAGPMGAAFVWDAGPSLARRIPTLVDEIGQARLLPPPPESYVARYEPATGRWEDVPAASRIGFYRFRPRVGPTQFRLISSVGAVRVDRPIGIYAALDRAKIGVIWYQSRDVNGDVYVRSDAPLPTLRARALSLCSGLAPDEIEVRGVGTTRRYINVPWEVAKAVADSLSQPLDSMIVM